MRRYLLPAVTALAAIAFVSNSAFGLRVAFQSPTQSAASAPVVVTGKVTGFEKDLVMAEPYVGAKQKVGYKIAVVKIDTGLAGADKMKEVKIGFIPPAKPPAGGVRPPVGRPGALVEFKEGQELLLFLAKHPTGDFYTVPFMSPPVDISTPDGKKTLESVKKVTTTLAEPMKGLKSDKAEVRAETAAILLTKYRTPPEGVRDTEQVAIPADESKLILKGLLEGDWSTRNVRGEGFSPYQAFVRLGLNPKDHNWIQPVIVNVPGQPPPDVGLIMQDAFRKWLEGPGKDFVIKKVVAKTAADK